MKILLFCYEYPPIGGGGGVGAQQYAEAWVARGHRVTVLTSRAPGLSATESVNGVNVLRVIAIGRKDRATATFLSMLCYNVTGLLHVLLHRRDFKQFDVINTHFSIPTGPLAAAGSWLLGLPNVLTIIGGDIYDPSKKSSPHRSALMRSVNRWVMNAAERVIAISSDTKRRAQEHYHVSRPIEVINYGFRPCAPLSGSGDGGVALEVGKFHLIAIGRLVGRKGFEYVIRAMKDLPEEIVLLLIGDGPLESNLKELAASEGVSDRIRMPGFLSRQQIYSSLRQADCFVLPSLHEGLGIVVQEAMEAGLPIVATDNGGQVDLVKYPRNGILVATENSEALARAIYTLYKDRDLARSMGANNRVDIERLHIDKNCGEYIEVFEQVTESFNLEKSWNAA